jgi:hypothetical protein
MSDPVVERVREMLLKRSETGIAKYGVNLARDDLDLRAWLNHALEECLDQANYLMRAIVEIDGQDENPLKTVDARYRDLLKRLGVNGHDGALSEIEMLREKCGLNVGSKIGSRYRAA